MHRAKVAKETTKKPTRTRAVPREDSTKTLSHARFDKHKTTDPFAKQSAAKTAFARAYIAGEIPARINHGGVRHTLQWDVNPRGASGPSPLLLPMLMPLPAGLSHPSPASRLTLNPSRGRPLVRPTADHLLRGAHGEATSACVCCSRWYSAVADGGGAHRSP